jgi:alkaline phosphatase
MGHFQWVIIGMVLPILAASAPDPATDAPAPIGSTQRNVILIIGDGMGEQQVSIARNYLQGAAGRLLVDQMPVRATVQVLTSEDKIAGKPVYVADSANTATAMAAGIVTSRGRIGTAPGSDSVVPNIVELAERAGYRTGIVTTASVTDATPAGFFAHINFRLCENPAMMTEVTYRDIYLGECSQHLRINGGAGSISEQLAESGLDVVLGGGSKHFQPNAEGQAYTVRELAEQRGFTTVDNAAGLAAAEAPRRLLGLFSPSTMPVRLQGSGGRSAEHPEPSLLNQVHGYLGNVTLPAPMHCEPNPGFAAVPGLKTMTEAALALLSRDNDRGFFLMVESASIDKQAHERKPCGSIGEMEQLEEALASSLEYARLHPDTLVLVTADHSQAAQLVPFVSLFDAYPVPVFTPGQLARIVTPEGSTLAVNYATNNFLYEEHTGASVPLYANEPGRDLVPPFLQQPQLFQIMSDYLRLSGSQ